MVVSHEIVIKCNPEHLTLADYLEDNPHPPCPIVGLDNITEFWPGHRKPGDKVTVHRRPLYHCSLSECYNEQGSSRQMMEHLMRQYHVESWVKERGESVPQDMHDLVKLCKELTEKVDLGSMKVIMKEELWKKCMEARLRLTKRQAEALHRKEKRNKGDAGSNAKLQCIDPVIEALRAAKKNAPREKIQKCSEAPSSASNSSLNIKPSRGKSSSSKHSLPYLQSMPVPSSSSSIMGVSSPVSMSSLVQAQPTSTVMTSTSTTVRASDEINVPDVSALDCAINSIGFKPIETEESLINRLSGLEEFTMQTLNLSDSDRNMKNDETVNLEVNITEETVEHTEIRSLTRRNSLGLNPKESDIPDLQPSSRTEISIEDTKVNEDKSCIGPQPPVTEVQKKLSLKEYQEKLRKQRQGSDPPDEEEDIKPFQDDDGIEVVGMKQANVDTSRFGTLEPPVKKEKPSGDSRDLLDTGSEEVVVEATVKAPQIDPIQAFKFRVTDLVKIHLLNYYAKDSKDLNKKNGELKEIKIKTENEFMEYCKYYSKKFQSDILEAYTAINGSIEGIEKENIKQYGIEFDIDKYFSQK